MPELVIHNKPMENASTQATNWRLVRLSVLAALIGIVAGFVAYLLVSLIGLISNLVFFQRVGTEIPDLQGHTLGVLVIIVPIIGGLIVGLLAKFSRSLNPT